MPMPVWLHTLNFHPFWDDDLPIEEKGRRAAAEIKRVFPKWEEDVELIDFVDGFESVAAIGEFDAVLSDLYDWADENRVWVATFFASSSDEPKS